MRKPKSNPEILLSKYLEMHDKDDILTKSDSRYLIEGYGVSETNCVDKIGVLDQPNVTKIAKELNLSRGAVSKIIKKLISSGDVVSYQNPGNKKEIYYQLTEKGQLLFIEHQKRHESWKERQLKFFENMQQDELAVVCNFFTEFNKNLERQIRESKKKKLPINQD
ncbi:MarR family transcriptional regulator [Dehalobacterium formicoaceticum]|uniref:MarR family transcriptional regulator n=1 Tax=Dehalobacterium formicoaceticum TaxID=51515 RepID=A0ABT1YAH7_9FIRM|nr:MarR family transcriptional regulator [Dehalobacterium formicoaceticum]MCR6546656.1 MarR family transcriptional regulator [Dehalobacterium formicoaceticum]